MRRRTAGLVLAGVPLLALFVAAGLGQGYSDGTSGWSGAIAEHQRKCIGAQYCKVVPSYCGGCHGEMNDMKHQEGSNPSPYDRVNQLEFLIKGDPEGGTSRGVWEYTPGESMTIDIWLPDARPEGQYNSGAFNLNASAGRLSRVSSTDDTVRITGGTFFHAGSKNTTYNLAFCGQPSCPVGNVDESAWPGEATQTAKGAERREWRVKWTAPTGSPEPHGVAFVMTAMLPNGDSLLNCVRQECNASRPYAAQSTWDWYGFNAPRPIMCEKDYYPDYVTCRDTIQDFILPPSPPLNTNQTCAPDQFLCPTTSPSPADDTGGGSPSPGSVAVLAAVLAAAWTARRARRH